MVSDHCSTGKVSESNFEPALNLMHERIALRPLNGQTGKLTLLPNCLDYPCHAYHFSPVSFDIFSKWVKFMSKQFLVIKMSSWHITRPQVEKKGLWYGHVHWGTSWLGRGTSWLAGMGDMDGGHWIPWERLRELRVWKKRKRIRSDDGQTDK